MTTQSPLELTVSNAESEPRPTREGQVSTLAARGKPPVFAGAAHSGPHRAVQHVVYPQPASSAFAVYTAIATAFSSSLISFLKPRPLGAFAKMCCKFSHVAASFSHVGASFSTCTCLRQDEILSPQEIPASEPQQVPSQGVFEVVAAHFQTVAASFSHVGASFQLALPRQDEILSPQEILASDPQLVPSQGHLNCGCEFSHVGASFPTCTCLRQDEILSPQEIPASDPQLVPNWRQ